MISIVVPVYNAAPYIAQTIASVRAQTYTEWELILVDDASTDTSVSRIREQIADCTERISLITLDQNRGVWHARNVGVDAAKGRYIAFLDADDLWEKEKLKRTFAFLCEEEAPFVFTAYAFGDANACPTGKEVHVPPTLTFREALTRTVIFTSTVMIDAGKIAKKWIHMPDMESEDTATWWRILRKGVTARGLDEVLTVYRRSEKTLSSNKAAALRRIWGLYRSPHVAGLNPVQAASCVVPWAARAAFRRL